jgi:3-oxoadipate enol-lactonase
MAMPAAEIELHHWIAGSPAMSTVVLSHALGASMAMWDPQLAPLTAIRQVLRYDHRGQGGSPVTPGPYNIEMLARDLIRLLDRRGLDRVSFCGLSLGGMVGIWLAANAPDRIDRLVLCCTAARMPRPEDFAARATVVRRDGMGAVVDAVMARWFTPDFAAGHPQTVESIRASFLATPAEGYAAACEAIAAMDQRDLLPRIKVPTLVIAAAMDQSTPPELSREIAAKIPRARLVIIPDAAHLANVASPDAVNAAIGDHLLQPVA